MSLLVVSGQQFLEVEDPTFEIVQLKSFGGICGTKNPAVVTIVEDDCRLTLEDLMEHLNNTCFDWYLNQGFEGYHAVLSENGKELHVYEKHTRSFWKQFVLKIKHFAIIRNWDKDFTLTYKKDAHDKPTKEHISLFKTLKWREMVSDCDASKLQTYIEEFGSCSVMLSYAQYMN